MSQDRSSWPLTVGITAGIVGGAIAVGYLYATRSHQEPEARLRDAKEIMAHCHETIREIESRLDQLRTPSTP